MQVMDASAESVTARFKNLRARAGLSMDALAQRLGYKRASSIQRYESPSDYAGGYLKRELVSRLDKALTGLGDPPIRKEEIWEMAGPEFARPTRGVAIPDGPLSYGGTVAAGDWLNADDFNQDMADNRVPATVPRHPAYPHLQQVAWRVKGDSMDEAGIQDGMWLVGTPYLDYIDRVGELDNGNFVVAERTRYQGSERELTVKEVQFSRQGMRLIPRSSNPKHREFFIPLDEAADNDRESVRILGVVLWAVRDLAPGTR